MNEGISIVIPTYRRAALVGRAIESALDHAGVYVQLAYLHELRMMRKIAEGDAPAAAEAFRRGMHWMRTMASSATSGGEGAAYTLQVKQHHAHLVAALGYDAEQER